MANTDPTIDGSINPGGRIDIACIKLALTREGFDDGSIDIILSACRRLGLDIASANAINQAAYLTAVLLLCGYDVDFSGMFHASDKQPLSQAVSEAFKKIRDDNKIAAVPLKGKHARHENARELVAELLEKRTDMIYIKSVANDSVEKMDMEKHEDEERPETAEDPAIKPAEELGRGEAAAEEVSIEPPSEEMDTGENTASEVKISVPAKIVIGRPAVAELQRVLTKSLEATVVSMMEQAKADMFDSITELINTRLTAPFPEKQEPVEKEIPVPEMKIKPIEKKPFIHLVVIDLNHLYIYSKNTRIYYENAWLETIMKKIYSNVVSTAKKLGIEFSIDNLIGRMFLSKKYAFLEHHIDDFGIGSKDTAMRAFPGKFTPWQAIPGTKYSKGREVELDVDTWVVKEIDVEILKRHPGEIATLHVVSGDKDMIPAVETAREEGVHVVVMSYKRATAVELMAKANDVQYLD